MRGWIISYTVLTIGTLSLGFQLGVMHENGEICQAHHERNLSPHEQQPEPIPAVTQGGIDVERWVL